jgi:hypothetical protein
MSPADIERACPYKIAGRTYAGCCAWQDFLPSFAEYWLRWFAAPPTPQQWGMARSDWKAGNTGYEAAHNAQRRMREANTPAARQQRETRALARSVIAIAKASAEGEHR